MKVKCPKCQTEIEKRGLRMHLLNCKGSKVTKVEPKVEQKPELKSAVKEQAKVVPVNEPEIPDVTIDPKETIEFPHPVIVERSHPDEVFQPLMPKPKPKPKKSEDNKSPLLKMFGL